MSKCSISLPALWRAIVKSLGDTNVDGENRSLRLTSFEHEDIQRYFRSKQCRLINHNVRHPIATMGSRTTESNQSLHDCISKSAGNVPCTANLETRLGLS